MSTSNDERRLLKTGDTDLLSASSAPLTTTNTTKNDTSNASTSSSSSMPSPAPQSNATSSSSMQSFVLCATSDDEDDELSTRRVYFDDLESGGSGSGSGGGVEGLDDDDVHRHSSQQHRIVGSVWAQSYRTLIVLALALASPLQLVSLFVAGGDVPVICFGLLVGAMLVSMTSRHVLRGTLHVRRELDLSLLIASVIFGSLFTAFTVGNAMHHWTLFAHPFYVQPSQVRRPLYESVPVADDAWLPVYDLARIKFEVQRDHVGQYVAKDGQIVCVAPIAARKQLAKEIHSRDDVPTNWAVCTGFPEPPGSVDEMPFDCAKFYLSLTGSDYDRANVLRRRDVSDGAAEHAPTTVARNELELCILDWVHHTIAFDLRFVQPKTVQRATQAAKDSLQRWSGDLFDDQDNPLGTFDDDEDLRHLSFVRLVSECCSFESAHSSTAALMLLLIGNGGMVIYVVFISSWTQRRPIWQAALGFVAWVMVMCNVLPRFSLPISQ